MKKKIPLLTRKSKEVKASAVLPKKKALRTRKAAVLEKEPAAVVKVGLFNLRPPKGAHKPRKIKGRGSGSGHGKTSTRGSKGQTSRSGRATYPGFEGGQMPLIRKIPKRGFTSIFKKGYQVVNVGDLVRAHETVINPEVLHKAGLIKDKDGRVKVLGDGEIKQAVTVSVHAVSKGALDKINGAGGKVELIHA